MPPTESARSALSAFTCTLCNKSYSRHPEFEAHIGSYDHLHRQRLQDLKQLSRDPNAAEKARRAERKADAEAGLKVLDAPTGNGASKKSTLTGGFKKGGFKSSFTTIKGPVAAKKNVLEDSDDERPVKSSDNTSSKDYKPAAGGSVQETESDDEQYTNGQAYYDPRRPTSCFPGCPGREVKVVP
ncbi:C2H2 finger domain protein [Penicillium taxi]|uniref:C2H2 finger domain protein n=1 Tax=Penicillium taxi TaxID=168475 RepID=UPI0025455D9F|nr:C2H2 finger domain protein [Penicillium taxi]KAJ5885342.1 C2H2 finger domain protein [Penicillium taxi]